MKGVFLKRTLLLTVAGVASGLFIVVVPLTLYVAGALFGAAIAISVQKLGVFNQRQAGWFVAVSTLAYYASLGLVLKLGVFNSNADSHSPVPLMVGGGVGALLVVGGALFLLRPKIGGPVVLVLASCGAACGALLSAAGSALGSSLGLDLSKLLYNLPSHLVPSSDLQDRYSLQNLYALFIVWQTGMGFVLGLMLGGRPAAAREARE
jgi:hypothetical protein